MPKQTTHGGKRPGAGRKRIGDKPSEVRAISLPAEWWDYASSLDAEQGSVSAGVRAALTFHAEAQGKRKAKTG